MPARNRMRSGFRSLVALASLVGVTANVAAAEPLKVGFLYVGPASGAGWSYAHELARRKVQATYGDKVQTLFVEKVAEADSERVVRDLVAQGAQLVFGAAFGFMDGMVRVARDHPEVAFEHATGYKTSPNLGIYDIRTYEGACLNGVIAGRMSKSGVLGFVAPFPIPEVVRNLNAYTLCAQAVNPKVTTKVVWINTWYDPVREREAASALVDAGVDVLMQNSDSPSPLQVAKEKGLVGFGWDTDMAEWGGDAQMAASRLDWSVHYNKVVADVLAKRWKPGNVWLGLRDKAIIYDTFSAKLPAEVKALVETRKADIISGKRPVFQGPIVAQDGSVKVKVQADLPDADKLKMNWLVKGVQGNLPK
ncbi:BMP family ABC transporter substrate-binding protein [Ottowia sp.]|uniref:BMP family ABC transporter substrate-binding protein n=1 Tax=Ottowia sp. TaxID=1898956 RepID=UPI00261C8E30|nr:BMP family ABC transporter substrate-binding protein [Ottowia sp.]